jgi:GntR family transcriptional regulator / MocR family aminotransferase
MYLMIWVNGLVPSDGDALVKAASQRQLAIYPATPYYCDPPQRLGLIMGFSAISAKEIPAAVKALAQAIYSLDLRVGQHTRDTAITPI